MGLPQTFIVWVHSPYHGEEDAVGKNCRGTEWLSLAKMSDKDVYIFLSVQPIQYEEHNTQKPVLDSDGGRMQPDRRNTMYSLHHTTVRK